MSSSSSSSRAWGLQHHFDSYEQQQEASFVGMWLFLAQEIMFFGGLFAAYIIYRMKYTHEFAMASNELDITLGGINTVVLIGSSLTMALAVRSAAMGKRKTLVAFLALTLVLGGVFLGIKTIEYSHKWEHHHVPGPDFHWDNAAEKNGAHMFFNLYFTMTGLHALHMIIGMGILVVMIWWSWRGAFTPQNHNFVEGMGLYWHFVDIVWIFLFPLLYLLGRNLPHV